MDTALLQNEGHRSKVKIKVTFRTLTFYHFKNYKKYAYNHNQSYGTHVHYHSPRIVKIFLSLVKGQGHKVKTKIFFDVSFLAEIG